MGTAATPTQYGGLVACGSGLDYMGIFKLLLDTTDGTGIQTVDLTAYFKTVQGALIGGNGLDCVDHRWSSHNTGVRTTRDLIAGKDEAPWQRQSQRPSSAEWRSTATTGSNSTHFHCRPRRTRE